MKRCPNAKITQPGASGGSAARSRGRGGRSRGSNGAAEAGGSGSGGKLPAPAVRSRRQSQMANKGKGDASDTSFDRASDTSEETESDAGSDEDFRYALLTVQPCTHGIHAHDASHVVITNVGFCDDALFRHPHRRSRSGTVKCVWLVKPPLVPNGVSASPGTVWCVVYNMHRGIQHSRTRVRFDTPVSGLPRVEAVVAAQRCPLRDNRFFEAVRNVQP
jgi:hypothetical protein